MKKLLFGLVLLFAAGSSSSLVGQTVYPQYVDGSLYLKVKDSSLVSLDPYLGGIPALDLIIATLGIDSIYHAFKTPDPALQRVYRVEFLNAINIDPLILQLQLLGFVEFAEKVPLMTLTGPTALVPNDLHPNQWGLVKINAAAAWGISLGSAQVKVAIVDNAILSSHEDLTDIIWTNPGEVANNLLDDDLNGFADDKHGYDVADMDANVAPPTGMAGWDHGSHCAGVAGASTDNGVGIASIGYGISIIPVKATNNASGGNSLTKAYEGVDYAMRAGADIISMSWGSTGGSAVGQLILNFAQSRGILLVAAAGNNGDSIPFYPAAYPVCLTVGSTDQFDVRSSFSNFGSYVDVMAPGSDIYSCFAGSTSDYGVLSGTSMACPLVAGLAGLLLSHTPTMTAQDLRDAIVMGCENIDALNPGFAGKLGAGRINAFNSINGPVGVSTPSGATHFTAFPNPSTGSITLRFDTNISGFACSILDLTGTVVYAQHFAGTSAQLDLDLPAGIYLLECNQGGSRTVIKLVIKQ